MGYDQDSLAEHHSGSSVFKRKIHRHVCNVESPLDVVGVVLEVLQGFVDSVSNQELVLEWKQVWL